MQLILSIISLIAYLVAAYFFVSRWDYGIRGIAFAMNAYGLTYIICAQIAVMFVITELKDVIFFPTKESFENWGEWIRLALPAVLVFFAGPLVLEIYIILAGRLSQ